MPEPPIKIKVTETPAQAALWGVLNSVRVAIKYNRMDYLKDIAPRIEEVLDKVEKEIRE